ncbi:hypothetical protein ABI59_10390 [Acidobacteria bacterium Mor1]|nr:hypothetical protein ABI59_10390 [Acidobacteria bacterium Mor1]
MVVLAQAVSPVAAESTTYIGFGVGYSEEKDVLRNNDFESNDVGAKLFGGILFNELIALEVGYYDYGDFRQQVGSDLIEQEVEALVVMARGRLPLSDRFYFSPKLGAAVFRSDSLIRSAGGVAREVEEDASLAWGIGFGVELTRRFDLRIEIESLDSESTKEVELYSASFEYRF